ncbi:MAG: VWA domain-containing protein [Burkholderiaceae bacterium]
MERVLTSFVRALRAAGAPISTTEAIDAAQAVALVGYSDRLLLKDTLSSVLAKSEEEVALLGDLFDLFFSSQAYETGQRRTDQSAQEAKAHPENDKFSGDPSQDNASSAGDEQSDRAPSIQALIDLANNAQPEQLAMRLQQAGAAVGVDNIHFASQRAYFSRRMLQQMGIEQLEEQLQAQISDPSEQAQREAQALIDTRTSLQRRIRDYIDQRFEIFGRAATQTFLNDIVADREIGELDGRDLARMKTLIARMAKRLAARHSRRRRPRQRGMIDGARTLRANAGNDGVPFELILKRKRLDRPKVVVVCDVSGSVSRYVRFLLLFLYSLNETIRNLRSFAFSSQLYDVSDWFDELGFEPGMKRIIRDVGAGSTDYGQALLDLKTEYWDTIDRRTTVIILGDGRTNQTDPKIEILAEIAQRAKRLVWLCPEDRRRWGSGDSVMHRYEPYCHTVAHCATANDLEQAIEQVLQAYD